MFVHRILHFGMLFCLIVHILVWTTFICWSNSLVVLNCCGLYPLVVVHVACTLLRWTIFFLLYFCVVGWCSSCFWSWCILLCCNVGHIIISYICIINPNSYLDASQCITILLLRIIAAVGRVLTICVMCVSVLYLLWKMNVRVGVWWRGD
jgi:hypothetical protein